MLAHGASEVATAYGAEMWMQAVGIGEGRESFGIGLAEKTNCVFRVFVSVLFLIGFLGFS